MIKKNGKRKNEVGERKEGDIITRHEKKERTGSRVPV